MALIDPNTAACSNTAMKAEDAIPMLKAIIARERKEGCPMASEDFIEPALRRWRSYERRFKRHKDKSLKHRAHDVEKGLREFCGFYYAPGCIRHLAQSFAEVLMEGCVDNSATSPHKGEERPKTAARRIVNQDGAIG
jgi:hypothetical protein